MNLSKTTMRQNHTPEERFSMDRRAMLTFLIGGATVIVVRSVRAAENRARVTLYKDPQCGCCESYADYLRSNGFEVSIVPTHDLPLLNEKYGIRPELQPCHISLIGGYVVGGHVPIEIVNRLLTERSKVIGITLPGRPLGSPGMNGEKIAPFMIYVIGPGVPELYATV